MSSPVLWGPNSKATNLQQGTLQPDGTYNNFNGPKNYVSLGNFANGLATGWSAVGCATVTNGLLASVGSSGLAFSAANGGRAAGANTTAPAVSATTPLSGLYSLNLATSGAGTIGDMYISQAYNLEVSDQAQPLNITLDYKVMSGTPSLGGNSSNTYALMIYDMVNNAWIVPSGVFNFVQLTGAGRYTGSFQTPINMVGFQIAIYSPVAPTGASSLYLNNIFLGPQTSVLGVFGVVGNIISTGSLTAPVGYLYCDGSAVSRTQYADLFKAIGTTYGVGDGSTTFNIPNGKGIFLRGAGSQTIGGVASTATLGSTQGDQMQGHGHSPIGNGSTNIAYNTGSGSGLVSASGGNGTNLLFAGSPSADSSGGGTTPRVGTETRPANIAVAYHICYLSQVVMSSDTDTRVIAMQVAQAVPTATLTGTASLVKYTSGVVTDTAGAYSTTTGLYTCPVSGQYRVTTALQISATYTLSSTAQVGISKNGAAPIYIAVVSAGGAQGQLYPYISTIIPCNAGDTLAPYAASSGSSPSIGSGVITNYFMVERLSGPAVVSATESVNGRYYSSVSTISGTDATVTYATKDFDSHNAYSSGTLTIPVSGKYQLNAAVTVGDASGVHTTLISFYKNGAQISQNDVINSPAGNSANVLVSDIISCLSGDLITVKVSDTGTTPTIGSNTVRNYFSWSRVGN